MNSRFPCSHLLRILHLQRCTSLDSFTRLVLGAAVGEAATGRKLGRRALLWGGLAGTIPDLDVFVALLLGLSEPAGLRFHRGPTHTLAFAFVAAPVFG